MMTVETYPVRVDASQDARLSRWLWLVKWILAIPHYVVLVLLWAAFVLLSIAAFFAILLTGRYPRPVFDFNVGVLRWTWRVQYYSYGALATDRYPPFSLAESPGYPAHLEIEYPARLSRGLVLVKWWLLAIPHYLVVGLFAGGGWAAWQYDGRNAGWAAGGLIGILVLIAAVALAFTGRYPKPIFDFVLGMNRWVLRVAAYAGLMTDRYPPFRLDMGGADPATITVPPGPPAAPGQSDGGPPASQASAGQPSADPAAGTGWTAGRVVCVVVGSVLSLLSVGLFTSGGALLWASQTQRQDGYLTSATSTYSTGGYALATDTIRVQPARWDWPGFLVGKVRIRVTSTNPATPVFAGIAPAGAAATYLSGVPYTTLTGFAGSGSGHTTLGTAAPSQPASSQIWAAQATGTGRQSLVWVPRSGDWSIVVMNADASPGVTVTADAGATVPGLPWIAAGLLAGGALILILGVVLIVVPAGRASRARVTSRTTPP